MAWAAAERFDSDHSHSGPLEGRGVEAILCAGVGRRAVAALEGAGAVRVLGVSEACGGHHGESGGHCHGAS